MFGALTIDVSYSAFLLLIALWLIARHEADLEWSKLLMVSAGTGLLSIVPPLYVWTSLLERYGWDLAMVWPVVLLGTLAWQIGVFAVMLNRFVWVPIPKAILAWFVIQVLVIVKDCAFALIRGQSLVDSAWTSVTGMESPGQRREARRQAEESERRMQAMRKAMEQGDLVALTAEVDASSGPVAATASNPPVAAITPVETNPPVAPVPQAPPVEAAVAVAPPPPVATQAAAVVQAVVPAVVAVPPAPEPAPLEAEREASRKLLVINGRTQQRGRIVLLVNGQTVEVGDSVTVSSNGRRFSWRLAGFSRNQPVWE